METTKNKLSQEESVFFDKLKNYIDKPIYFYGSIQRDDYFPQLSDIDIDIFSDNINSTLKLLL
jgi:predicted nucleotidyltransferase